MTATMTASQTERAVKTFTINKGRVCTSFIEGRPLAIYLKPGGYPDGQPQEPTWRIDLQQKDGEIYSLSFGYHSGEFRSIILCLASSQGIDQLTPKSKLLIEPYFKDGYTKVKVSRDGVKLNWLTKDLPPFETVTTPEGNRYKDDSKVLEFISNLARTINQRLTYINNND